MKRILIIRLSALGDVALLVPVVRTLAEQYPALRITMLSHCRMADLFAQMPSNVTFAGVDPKTQSLREIVAGLGRFDLVADMHDVWRSRYIRGAMRLRKAKVRTICKGYWSKWLLTHHLIHRPLQSTIARYADVLRILGFPITLPTNRFHDKGQGIGIAPFAAHRGKAYPLKQMERVVQLLSERGEQIALFGGGAREEMILADWASKYKGVVNTAGKLNLAQQLGRMRSLRVMVTMDSANMHLASLVGTRVVSVWGATHPYAGFLGFGQQLTDCLQRDLPCRPCSVYGKKSCKYGDYRCLNITPEEIIARLNDID